MRFAILSMAVVMLCTAAHAGTSCTTRKSGSVTITSCSESSPKPSSTTCRSYRSGSVVKTSCS